MTRITVDARMYSRSGIGTYLRNVLPRLVQRAPADRYRLLGGEELHRADGLEAPPVEHVRFAAPIYSVREQLELPRLVGRDSDLLWSPHYNVPLRSRTPVLATIHDLAHLAVPGIVAGHHRRLYARVMLRAAGRAAATVFVSRFSADEYARLFGRRPRTSRVIHQGVDASWFSVPRDGSPHARPYILFVGNVKPHKNVVGLLRAFELLRDSVPHDLVILGRRDGFIHGSPEVAAEAARLGGRVHFTGWLEEPAVKRHFAHAGVLVIPSFYEGFGLPPLEAMACGCPVVVSRAASLPEVCGEAALYCEPRSPRSIADAIQQLLRDPVLRDEQVERGRERARRFTWERCVAETAELMQETMNR